jgi:hypothetical protein
MLADPHAGLRDRVLNRVLDGPGEADPSVRHAAANGSGVPTDLQPLVDKIQRHAYKVTDQDISAAQARYGDDKVFEIVVSTALGAAQKRLLKGLEVLDQA